jgi:hypothetical protein
VNIIIRMPYSICAKKNLRVLRGEKRQISRTVTTVYFTVVYQIITQNNENFSSFIVRFYDSRITKKNLILFSATIVRYLMAFLKSKCSWWWQGRGGVVELIRDVGEVVMLQVEQLYYSHLTHYGNLITSF